MGASRSGTSLLQALGSFLRRYKELDGTDPTVVRLQFLDPRERPFDSYDFTPQQPLAKQLQAE